MEDLTRSIAPEDWYKNWFDSPYYHLLYGRRNEAEAEDFLSRLLDFLRVKNEARVMDMGCGKGRYARFLAEKGCIVTGIDLSAASIKAARRHEHQNLSFFNHDMRHIFRVNYFDYIFSFFTSFGYFPDPADDMAILKNVHKGLRNGGRFTLDFFNSTYIRNNLVPREKLSIRSVSFEIDRWIDRDWVVKRIRVNDNGRAGEFFERVRLFSHEKLNEMLLSAGLQATHRFGDYKLGDFHEESSPRLIFIANKIDDAGDDYWMGRTDILLD